MILPGGKLRAGEDGALLFWCPGCDGAHQVMTGPGAGPRWGYNGDPGRPTFTPSVLVKSGHYVSTHKPDDPCWCDYEQRLGKPAPFQCMVCHSFVTDGRIQFLGDCTHQLAGQTVDLPKWEDG
jgi:hypothetical protein